MEAANKQVANKQLLCLVADKQVHCSSDYVKFIFWLGFRVRLGLLHFLVLVSGLIWFLC